MRRNLGVHTGSKVMLKKSLSYLGIWRYTAEPERPRPGGVGLQVLVFGGSDQDDRLAVLGGGEGPVLRDRVAKVAPPRAALDHRYPRIEVEGAGSSGGLMVGPGPPPR